MTNAVATDVELDTKLLQQINEFEIFMDDDFSSAKVLANMFEIVPVINSIKAGHIGINSIAGNTLLLMQQQFKIFIEDIFGLMATDAGKQAHLQGVMSLLIDIRQQAKINKDYATSDKIRQQLTALGIGIKDEKDGTVSWDVA